MRPLAPLPVVAVMASLVGTGAAQAETLEGILRPLNQKVSGQTPGGTVILTRDGGAMSIELTAEGLSPGMHLAHLHGFPTDTPDPARCPGADADTNGDGIIDLKETEDAAGITLVPLTRDPAGLTLKADSYPTAGEDGRATYSQKVEFKTLDNALHKTHNTPAALDRRVLFIHGVPEGTALPDTVRSLEGVPARVTLPVACAELRERAQ